MTIRCDGAANGQINMAADRALLADAETGSLSARVYSWDGPWISLGRFQSAATDVSGDIPYVIRPTGGKAVLHGHDATIGLAVSLPVLGCEVRELKKAYRLICRPIILALNACGLDAALAEETEHRSRGPRTADCFSYNSPNDIVDPQTGKKVCGCALMLTERALLLQASIPCGEPLVDPCSVLREASDYVGPIWETARLASELEQALRYNFPHV